METHIIVLTVIAVIIGVLRFILPVEGKINPKDLYKDVAHLFVGGTFGAAFATGEAAYYWIAVLLTILEVYAFIKLKK